VTRFDRRAVGMLAGTVLLLAGQALDANQTAGFSGGRNPLGVDSPLVEAARPVGIALLLGGLVAAVASSVLRYRRARSVERQQLKWFAFAGLVLTLVTALAGAFWYRRLREQVDLDALSTELLAVVEETMQPTQASLWLRPPATPRPQPGPLATADATMAQPGARR
jgi:hypothetical protein